MPYLKLNEDDEKYFNFWFCFHPLCRCAKYPTRALTPASMRERQPLNRKSAECLKFGRHSMALHLPCRSHERVSMWADPAMATCSAKASTLLRIPPRATNMPGVLTAGVKVTMIKPAPSAPAPCSSACVSWAGSSNQANQRMNHPQASTA